MSSVNFRNCAAPTSPLKIEMKKLFAFAVLAGLFAMPALAQSPPIDIVAAENFYGDIAQQIGGPDVKVSSILSNPDQDPHLFEVSPSVARRISAAQIVVYSGIDYDPWMDKLLGAARSSHRKTIVVADLIGKKVGDNPHIWYDPATMLALAKTLAASLIADDPGHRAGYEQRLANFEASVKPIQTNNAEPSASDVAAFESDLKTHQVRLLIYNSQATDPIAERMEKIAKASHIPVVGATETAPAGKSYQAWMMSELDAVDR